MHYFTHVTCKKHEMGAGHPECPERLTSIESYLKQANLWSKLSHCQAESINPELLQLAHEQGYVQSVFDQSPQQGYVSLDADTTMNAHSLDASLLAAGAAVQAVDAVFDIADEQQQAFCAVRPPGHHAESDRAMGFCFFNSIAIAALYAIQQYDLKRVAVVDFDVHHGNGTENILAGNDKVLFISTFQHPLYPGSGVPASSNNIINFPLEAYSGSEIVRNLWQTQVIPYLNNFQPELLLVSAGFDAHAEDPLAQLNFQDDDYRFFAEQLKQVADSHCNGKMVACLEGGYNLSALGRSVCQFLSPWISKNKPRLI